MLQKPVVSAVADTVKLTFFRVMLKVKFVIVELLMVTMSNVCPSTFIMLFVVAIVFSLSVKLSSVVCPAVTITPVFVWLVFPWV